jgi:hypothetical protein
MPEVSRRLREALVDVYPEHVTRRLPYRPEGIEGAVEHGREWLAEALSELLGRPFAAQRRGPLELFQEAMRFPTEHLAAAGVEPIPRDPVAESALPGDVYDLAPASTRDLGEEVWQVHLTWGAAKAAAITGWAEPGSDAGGR